MRGAGVGDGGHRRAGRPRAFDAGQVLDCAMDRFWRDGYERVSVPDLSAATGLSTSSIYNSFGSKHGLYLACLDRYLDQLGQYLLGPMASGTAGTEDIAAFLDRLAAAQGSAAGPPGCLATNSIAEFGAGDAAVLSRTSRYRHDLRAALVAALRRAAGLGELPGDAVEVTADALTGIVLAFNLLAGARAPAAETMALLGAARAMLARPSIGQG